MTASISLGAISNEATRLAARRLRLLLGPGGAGTLDLAAAASAEELPAPCMRRAAKKTSLLAFTSVLEAAAQDRGLPHLGLQMAAIGQKQEAGILSDLFIYAPTVRHALHDAARFFPVIQTGTAVQLEHLEGFARFTYGIKDLSVTASLQDAAYTLGKVYLSLRRGLGVDWPLHKVTMASAAPSSIRAYEQFFGAPVNFAAGVSALWFPVSFLDRPLPSANMERYRAFCERAARLMPSGEDPALLADALRAWMLQSSRQWDVKLEHAAVDFGITPRTLQRRLKDLGLSFLDLRQQVRMETAQKMLSDSRLSVTNISEQLGFSEISAFTRAFRSHTRLSPRAFRQTAATLC